MALISIGLPVYNGENYIREAIDSLLAQTVADLELIISDNCSSDGTRRICEDYAQRDSRVRYFRNETNLGASRNYNRTFELATSPYFKWTSHDDCCAPDFLKRCLDILEAEPEVVLVYSQTRFIDADGNPTGVYADDLHLREEVPHERLRTFLARPGWCHPVFGLIRSAVLRKTLLIGNFPRSDRNLIGELALYGQIYEIPDCLFLRRLHPLISTTVNETEQALAEWYDPKMKGKLVFPRWRRFNEYLRAIRRAPLSCSEKSRCAVQVLRFVLIPGRWKGVVEDLVAAARTLPAVLARRCRHAKRHNSVDGKTGRRQQATVSSGHVTRHR